MRVRQGFTENKISRFWKEGRGRGRLSQYKPWLTTPEVTAKLTRKARFRGNKSGRVHHMFSDLEADTVFTIEWADSVLDVRERFPIDRNATLRIASFLGISHPVDRKSGAALVLYADLLVDLEDGSQVACSVVPASELEKKRILELLEVQRRYWKQAGTRWRLITEREVDRTIVHNIEFGRSHVDLTRQPEAASQVREIAPHLIREITRASEAPLQHICDRIDFELKQPTGAALFVLRHLVGTKQVLWPADRQIHTGMRAADLTVMLPR